MLKKLPLTIFLFPERHFGESEFGRSPTRPPPATNSETKMEELLKSTISAREGKLAPFSSCCTTSCVVCRSSSRFCSACLWLLLFLLFRRLHRLLFLLSVCLLQEMAAHSPLLWEDQRKISQLKSDFSIIDIYRLKNWTCFRHAFLNLLNKWNL